MLDFYETIYTTKKIDTKTVLDILNKIISNDIFEIEEKLKQMDFQVNIVNISDIYRELPSYQFLILRYMDSMNNFNHILIDPNYSGCLKQNIECPFYYDIWPSEILQNTNPMLLKSLLKDKYSFVSDNDIQDYLRSFTNRKVIINLETLILEKYKNRFRIA